MQRQVLESEMVTQGLYRPLPFLPLDEVIGFTFLPPYGFWEDEQLSGLSRLSGARGDLRPLVDLPGHSVRYTLFGLSA